MRLPCGRATVTLDSPAPSVDAKTLLTVARAIRETVRISFSYNASQGPSERRVEPYRLVATGRRWYLLAFDLDRDDWRTFRLDREFEVLEPPELAEVVRDIAARLTRATAS